MKDGLYLNGLFWDKTFVHKTLSNICKYAPRGVVRTDHYTEQIKARVLPRIPSIWELLNGKIIEVEIYKGDVVKALIRTRFDMENSIITVIKFDNQRGVLYITGWSNKTSDHHSTLNLEKYVKEEV